MYRPERFDNLQSIERHEICKPFLPRASFAHGKPLPGGLSVNPKEAFMFNSPTNSRANRFNGKAPVVSPDPLHGFHERNDAWLNGLRRRNPRDRFKGAKRIGRGPCWRKGSKFDHGDGWRRPLDRNDRARVMVCAEALERRTKRKHKRDGVLGQSALTVLRCLVNYFQDRHKDGRLDPSYAQIKAKTGFAVRR